MSGYLERLTERATGRRQPAVRPLLAPPFADSPSGWTEEEVVGDAAALAPATAASTGTATAERRRIPQPELPRTPPEEPPVAARSRLSPTPARQDLPDPAPAARHKETTQGPRSPSSTAHPARSSPTPVLPGPAVPARRPATLRPSPPSPTPVRAGDPVDRGDPPTEMKPWSPPSPAPRSAERRSAVAPRSTPPPALVSEPATVQVTIGRLEVRAVPSEGVRPPAPSSGPPAPALDDYLRNRERGGTE